MKPTAIAIDGTSASGKSRVASELASMLGYGYFNTGEVYRAITYILLNEGIGSEETEKVLSFLDKTEISLSFDKNKQNIIINGKMLGVNLKDKQINDNVAHYSKIPELRKIVVKIQKEQAALNNIVMEGRDIGTQVLPNADYKFFLSASGKERTNRRYKELLSKGINTTFDETRDSLFARDIEDILRECKPLTVAKDGYYIDTTYKTVEETLDYLLKIIKKEEK